MTTSTNQKPAAKLRDGAIVATLWKKEGEHGVFFNTTIARTYKDGDTFKEANSFSGSELLRVSRLAAKAYDLELELKAEAKAADSGEGSK